MGWCSRYHNSKYLLLPEPRNPKRTVIGITGGYGDDGVVVVENASVAAQKVVMREIKLISRDVAWKGPIVTRFILRTCISCFVCVLCDLLCYVGDYLFELIDCYLWLFYDGISCLVRGRRETRYRYWGLGTVERKNKIMFTSYVELNLMNKKDGRTAQLLTNVRVSEGDQRYK